MRLVNLKQGTPEWEEFRLSHVGASDIGTLMEGSEREIYDLLEIKRARLEKYKTADMDRGHELEADAIKWYTDDRLAHEKNLVALREPDDWLMASFDYIDLKTKLLVEAKCPRKVLDRVSKHSHYKRWWWQVQAQIAVSEDEGVDEGCIVAYGPPQPIAQKIPKDEGAIQSLLEKGKWFHNLMMQHVILPKPSQLRMREDELALEWSAKLNEIDGQIKILEEFKVELRKEGIYLAGEEPFSCNGVKVQKILCQPKIDYEEACRVHKIDMAPFTTPPKTPFTWRITPAKLLDEIGFI